MFSIISKFAVQLYAESLFVAKHRYI